MPQHKITAGKIIAEYKFQNVYYVETEEISSLNIFIENLIAMEKQIFLANVNLTTYSVKNLATPTAPPQEIPVHTACVRTQTGNPLPPFSVARVDLQTPGYAGKKEYRYSLTENDVDIWQINPAYITEIEAVLLEFIETIPVDTSWNTASDQVILVAQVYQYVQPRQLHRKRRRLELEL